MEKRRVLDEGFLRDRQMKIASGQMKTQERVFDPLLQRYRSNETEYNQRVAEETERINHLNRAMDIQVLREQPHHIIHHQSKFDALAPGADPTRQPDRQRLHVGKGGVPASQQDYNILSNLPYDVHHWSRPEARPRCTEQHGKQRMVQASKVRDFNIVNGRYHDDDVGRKRRDQEYALKEATQKFMKSNRFDPLVQQFNDPRDEENAKHCDDAREVEVSLRAEAAQPVSYTGRPTQFFDLLNNKVHNKEMVKHIDDLERERKDRYKNRYIVEHNFHAQDVKGGHITEARKLNKVAPERFLEQERGYCILSNESYGHTAKEKKIQAPYPQPRKSPWEEVMHGRSASTPALSSTAGDVQNARSAPTGANISVVPVLSRSGTGGSQRIIGKSSSLSDAGERTMKSIGPAQVVAPPGQTRPIPRTPSAPVLSSSASPAAMVATIDNRTRKLPSPMPLGESLTMTRAPAAPAIPGSPLGSVYSRPSGK
jgi:hypothetical protein